ncbi:hypothetical protein [Calothrix sp. 336/3]
MVCTFCLPQVSLAIPGEAIPSWTLAENSLNNSEINLTPQMRQQLQGVRQRRNRDIASALSSSQIEQLNIYLRGGDSLETGLQKLQLQPEQTKLIEAIIQISQVKIKNILSRRLF